MLIIGGIDFKSIGLQGALKKVQNQLINMLQGKRRKGISPIIAIIVILLITIAIAGSGYSYLSVYWTSVTSKNVQLAQSYCSGTRAMLVVKNSGTAEINLSDSLEMLGDFSTHPDAVGVWSFEGASNSSLDSSGSGNEGTLYGSTVLLMDFDSKSERTVRDRTSYGNDGTLYGSTVLLMHFDEGSGNPQDETSYGNHGTLQGDPQRVSGRSGSALELDGAGDYVGVALIDMGVNTVHTSSAWFKCTDTGSAGSLAQLQHPIFGYNSGSIYYQLGVDNNLMTLQHHDGSWKHEQGTTSVCDGNWHHLAWVSFGTTAKMYIDGSLEKDTFESDNQASIGYRIEEIGAGYLNRYADGTIDEVAIYSRALTEQEIIELSSAKKARFMNLVPGKSNSALEFNGNGNYVDLGNDADFDFGANDFSVSAWIKSSYTGEYQTIFSKGTPTGQGYYFVTGYGGSYLSLHLETSEGGWENVNICSVPVNDGNWHHAVLTKEGSTITFYVDGVQDAQGEAGGSTIINSASYNALIGKESYASSPWPFNGIIDELSVHSKALSPEEVEYLYDTGKAKFMERVPGRIGQAFESDGAGDYARISPISIPAEDFTFSLWFTMNQDAMARGSWNPILSLGGSTLYQHSSNNLLYFYRGGARYINWRPTTNEWHHLVCAVTSSGASGGPDYQATCYGDGEMKTINQGGYLTASTSLTIGSPGTPIEGLIDEVTIIDRALSPAEMLAQLTPACTCSGNACQCGDLEITKTQGRGDLFVYLSDSTITPGNSTTITDYSCVDETCKYTISSPSGSQEASVGC